MQSPHRHKQHPRKREGVRGMKIFICFWIMLNVLIASLPFLYNENFKLDNADVKLLTRLFAMDLIVGGFIYCLYLTNCL